MTTFKRWLNSPYVIAILLTFFALLDLFFAGLRAELTKSDWGTWVGSIGTVATLIGTIYLAQVETKRRKQQEHDAAVIAAAFMDLPLISYRRILSEVIAELRKPVVESPVNQWTEYAEQLAKCPVWTRDELQPLLYLGHRAAADLAIAQDWVGNARAQVELTAKARDNDFLEPFELEDISEEIADILDEALSRVSAAFDVCSELLDKARVV